MIKVVAMYEASCDACGTTSFDRGAEYTCWAHRDTALDEWLDSEWGIVLDDERVYCYGCVPTDVCELSGGDGKHSPSKDGLTCVECDGELHPVSAGAEQEGQQQ